MICKALSGNVPNSPDESQVEAEQAYTSWKNYLTSLFSEREGRGQSFLDKVETYLKPFFIQFFQDFFEVRWLEQSSNLTLSVNDRQNLQSSSFYQTHSEYIHTVFAQYVRDLESITGGRADLGNNGYRVLHHIVPRFDGGTDVMENRVGLHQYEHVLIHLFRYSWKSLSTDLNAFSSACLTNDQLLRRSSAEPTDAQLEARRKTTQDPNWQQTFGALGRANRGKPSITPSLKRAGSVAGQAFQWVNARARTNIFTWFLCTLPLGFKNTQSNEILWISPDPAPENHMVSKVAETLLTSPEHFQARGVQVLPERLSNLSQLFRGERMSMWNWSLDKIQVDGLLFSLQAEKLGLLRSFFADSVFLIFNSTAANFDPLKALLKTFYCSSTINSIGSEETFEKLFKVIQQFTTDYKTYLPKVVGNPTKASVLVELYKSCRTFDPNIGLNDVKP